MKSGWQTKTLGDICNFQNGFAFKSALFKPSGIPILRISNLQNDEVEMGSLVYCDPKDYRENLDRYRIIKGDLLIAMSGATTGKLGFNGQDQIFYLNQRVGKFEPSEKLNKRFLYYYLSTQVEENLRISAGAAQPNLSTEQILSFQIPLPPFPAQQRIVNILDEAFEGIAAAKANAEKNLNNARALFDSYLQSIFTQRGEGWVEKHLKDICEKITDGTHQTPTYHDEGVIFLSSRNVTSGRINWDHIKYIDAKQHLEMHKRVAPRLNDILLAKNGTTGVAAIVDRNVTFDIYVSLALLRARNEILPHFLLHFINSPVAKRQFNKRLKGIGVPNLHLEEIREVVISYPKSLAKQEAFATKIDALSNETRRLDAVYRQKLSMLEELKKSLLHQAFSGQL